MLSDNFGTCHLTENSISRFALTLFFLLLDPNVDFNQYKQ